MYRGNDTKINTLMKIGLMYHITVQNLFSDYTFKCNIILYRKPKTIHSDEQ